MWNLPPPPGFQGFRDELPVAFYSQHLPHWRQDGATYFGTFRLSDSLPQSKLRALRAFRSEWERRNPPPRTNQQLVELSHEVFRRVEYWLDQGIGDCPLRKKDAADLVGECLRSCDGMSAELGCYVAMPNHVHAIVRPLNSGDEPLEGILRQWKGRSARAVNELLRREGPLWQRESFDRIIRDVEHLYRVIQYIGRNPRAAGLSSAEMYRWINPFWVKCGWNFKDT